MIRPHIEPPPSADVVTYVQAGFSIAVRELADECETSEEAVRKIILDALKGGNLAEGPNAQAEDQSTPLNGLDRSAARDRVVIWAAGAALAALEPVTGSPEENEHMLVRVIEILNKKLLENTHGRLMKADISDQVERL